MEAKLFKPFNRDAASLMKLKPIVPCFHAISRASRQLHVPALRFDWFTCLSVSFMIGQNDYSGFRFSTLN